MTSNLEDASYDDSSMDDSSFDDSSSGGDDFSLTARIYRDATCASGAVFSRWIASW